MKLLSIGALVIVCAGICIAAPTKLITRGSELCFSCHDDLKTSFERQYVHSPVEENNCIGCHNPHAAKHPFMLSEGIPDLCYSCHLDEQENFDQFPYIHTAVKQGDCTGCHDPHSSDSKHLQKGEGAQLCYPCHKEEAEEFGKGDIHLPIEEGECSICHMPHASDFPAQLTDSPEQLCLNCHNIQDEAVKSAHSRYPVSDSDCLSCHAPHASLINDSALAHLSKGLILPNVHTPFGKGMCDSCHAEDSPDPIDLRAPQIEICYRCHSDMKKVVNNYPHVHHPVEDGRCVSCHAPHASKNENLLIATGTGLCADCHPGLMKKLDATYAHRPAVQGDCGRCHLPHGAEIPALLMSDSISTCQSCHESQAVFTHPIGKDASDPRSDEMITCVTCHDAHGNEYEFILLASRDRDLCVQCHKM